MSIIDRAAKRLSELNRPFEAAVEPATPLPLPRVVAVAGSVRGHSDLTLVEPRRPDEVAPSVPASPPAEPTVAGAIKLDLAKLERAGYLVSQARRTPLSEEFRRLKRPLLQAWRQSPDTGSILVTSAVPGEGKTFFALNLAMSLAAEINLHVLLVDADVAHHEAMQRLGVGEAALGLLDLASNPSLPIDKAILKTNLPKLEVLPPGLQRSSANELLASDGMHRVMDALMARRKNQIVVLDGPPLLATTEAQVLASRAGQVVMVVASTSTPRALVTQALESIESCPQVSMVLNKSAEPAVGHGYGYY